MVELSRLDFYSNRPYPFPYTAICIPPFKETKISFLFFIVTKPTNPHLFIKFCDSIICFFHDFYKFFEPFHLYTVYLYISCIILHLPFIYSTNKIFITNIGRIISWKNTYISNTRITKRKWNQQK